MPTTNTNKKILDLKRWEFITPAPAATAAGVCAATSLMNRQLTLLLTSAANAFLYDAAEDGWVQLPAAGLAGTFAAGASVTATSVGPTGTATGGSTSTVVTNLTLARNLAGYSIHITGGPGAGDTRTILSNTVGTNATITVDSAFSSAITASSTYRLLTPRWYVLNAITAAGTTTANVFRFYDYALNTWIAAETGATDGIAPAAVIGTDSVLVATPSWYLTGYDSFATGTATAGGASTISNSARNWTTNQWTNYQIRIVSGTGAGQIRTISSNTATQITVSSAWATQPDATSVYNIEGNDDFIYYMGSGAVTLFRYSVSAGTWTTLTPAVARAAVPGAGISGIWIRGATDSRWTNEDSIINGQRIYSFRGLAGAVLDYYDIAANTWVNAITYATATETFTTGTKYAVINGMIYIQKDATGRWFRYDAPSNAMDGWNTMLYPNGTAVAGNTAFPSIYKDGTTEIYYVNMILNTSAVTLRQMVI